MRIMTVSGLLAIVTLMLAIPSVFAQTSSDEVIIIPWLVPPDEQGNRIITVQSDQIVVLGARWGACTPGLARQLPPAAGLEWTINGIPLFSSQKDVRQYWSAPQAIPGDTSACINATDDLGWWTFWKYPLGYLEPGDYSVHLLYTISHPMIDGADLDGNGKPDIYEGTLIDMTITIHVEN